MISFRKHPYFFIFPACYLNDDNAFIVQWLGYRVQIGKHKRFK